VSHFLNAFRLSEVPANEKTEFFNLSRPNKPEKANNSNPPQPGRMLAGQNSLKRDFSAFSAFSG
jgi:hypothetical protein